MRLAVFKKSITGFLDDDPMTYAASLAFYTVVSLPAILLIAINVLSTAYERENIQDDLLQQLSIHLGPSTVSQAETIIENASLEYSGLLPQLFGWAVLFISATTVFISLQNGINRIWKVKPNPKNGFFKIILDRILSLAMLVSIGFVLLVSLVIDSFLKIFERFIIDSLGENNLTIPWVFNAVFSLIITSIVFTLIFRILPDVKTKWSNVWTGGIFTAIFFLIGKLLIGYYITSTDLGGAYGASGSLVVFLFWVYYSSVLVLFGAKFTYEYTLSNDEKLKSAEYSVFIKENIIAKDELDISDQ